MFEVVALAFIQTFNLAHNCRVWTFVDSDLIRSSNWACSEFEQFELRSTVIQVSVVYWSLTLSALVTKFQSSCLDFLMCSWGKMKWVFFEECGFRLSHYDNKKHVVSLICTTPFRSRLIFTICGKSILYLYNMRDNTFQCTPKVGLHMPFYFICNFLCDLNFTLVNTCWC